MIPRRFLSLLFDEVIHTLAKNGQSSRCVTELSEKLTQTRDCVGQSLYRDISLIPNGKNQGQGNDWMLTKNTMQEVLFAFACSGALGFALQFQGQWKLASSSVLTCLLVACLTSSMQIQLDLAGTMLGSMWKMAALETQSQIERKLLMTPSKRGNFWRAWLILEHFKHNYMSVKLNSDAISTLLLLAMETRDWEILDSLLLYLRLKWDVKPSETEFLPIILDRLYPGLSSSSFTSHAIHPISSLDLLAYGTELLNPGSIFFGYQHSYKLPSIHPFRFELDKLPFRAASILKLKEWNRINGSKALLLEKQSDLFGVRLILERLKVFSGVFQLNRIGNFILRSCVRLGNFQASLSVFNCMATNEDSVVLLIASFLEINSDVELEARIDRFFLHIHTIFPVLKTSLSESDRSKVRLQHFHFFLKACQLVVDKRSLKCLDRISKSLSKFFLIPEYSSIGFPGIYSSGLFFCQNDCILSILQTEIAFSILKSYLSVANSSMQVPVLCNLFFSARNLFTEENGEHVAACVRLFCELSLRLNFVDNSFDELLLLWKRFGSFFSKADNILKFRFLIHVCCFYVF